LALAAEAAQLAEPERGVIASMQLDVISDRRLHYMIAFNAKPTQRLRALNFASVRHRRHGVAAVGTDIAGLKLGVAAGSAD
jgi:hypothetical protein